MNTKKIKLPIAEGLIYININDIYFIQANDIYAYVHTIDSKILVFKSLKYLESTLSNFYFIRCHRSFLVNINFVEKITFEEKYIITFSNNAKCPLSRDKRNYLLNIIKSQFLIN